TAAAAKTGSWAGMEKKYPWPRKRKLSGKLVKLSVADVTPSARPRKSENDPSVTMSAGMRRRVISVAFSSPASPPIPSVATAATAIGRWASRHSLPNSTAERPMREPTDRSMPPVTITGVIASARRPISALSRTISPLFASPQKLRPRIEKTTVSATIRITSTPSWLRRSFRTQGGWSVCGKACANISSLPQINRIGRHGDQDNCALDRLLPVRLRLEEHQRGGDRAQEHHADEG